MAKSANYKPVTINAKAQKVELDAAKLFLDDKSPNLNKVVEIMKVLIKLVLRLRREI